ncbi:hypothetical protein MJO28_000674 [Puccinia striiformis f. sp. tritici]|uniref:Gfo/Idh/MocA-like oxidoreductase N-terminal domain-containing protein n=3 Tax=Puccinia striiformis f. sp. tritici TaxID=168172 RepID=A0A0L0V5X6_9BASI|nr:hypothetical protein Pst134EA_000578 [Puccinia striiformis f. sp. tritici]KAI9602023.1 hypothetical protein KEM48_000964 [Puccinia striiformis f. sp. tritici PST-130]KNE94705.1 hypothetical protein PSTG_11980 [Puccinia striiformis f. sp. tritici PST-78]KAH9466733.1 hypothetical protein Pst134EB_001784 [Puccinia striiformis f. sp. tritici]KAH9473499.1 hypothetical protein Pst134EA_000578 [Puccinia striiformis f. sp. tritici]KAI7962580.1 hypothetical protein MJO28_000674 [Puccinia striiformis
MTGSDSTSARKPSFGAGILGSSVDPAHKHARASLRKPSIDPARLGGMQALTPSPQLVREMKAMSLKGHYNVLFIGAGNINFGSDQGPWNHSVRLEHKLQTRMHVVGIIDPAIHRAKEVMTVKCATFVEAAYKDAKLCKSLDEFVGIIKPTEVPHAIVIGSPAQFHGSDLPGQDLELQCLKHFPEAALFVEKPISCAPVKSCYALAKILDDKKSVVSVGYMLRYLQVIQQMQRIIAETGKPVMMVVARYVCSYAKIDSEVWWNKSKSLGPIVEQGTHLVDLCRYFGGEAILETVQATSTEHYEEAGKLEAIPIDESKIPANDRVPRTTSAIWKFDTGAVCSFSHALTLQGTKYSTELEVYLDGWQMKVVDLYNEPTLYVRSPEADAEQKINFPSDDPYFSEISAWIDASENKNANNNESAIAEDDEEDNDEIPNGILSTFKDSCGTYALTWAIKEASERALKTGTKPTQ